MRLVVSEFVSLDGVVQAPGGAEEDTDGGFSHGGWSMRWFDPEVMGSAIDPDGGHAPWALQVLELRDDRVAGFHSFLDTEAFERFGFPAHL